MALGVRQPLPPVGGDSFEPLQAGPAVGPPVAASGRRGQGGEDVHNVQPDFLQGGVIPAAGGGIRPPAGLNGGAQGLQPGQVAPAQRVNLFHVQSSPLRGTFPLAGFSIIIKIDFVNLFLYLSN